MLDKNLTIVISSNVINQKTILVFGLRFKANIKIAPRTAWINLSLI